VSGQIVEYPSREALMRKLADRLAERLRALVAEKGRASLAVPGGTTPALMLTVLGAADLPWDKVAVTLTDERWVPVSSQRSNQRLLTETLFRGAAAAAEFAPLYGGTAEPETGLGAVETTLRQIILPLDVAVLGMGADMHTASLFPGAAGLEEALSPDAPPVVAVRAPGAEEPRITLSAPVLAAAERHLLIAGKDKRAALNKALSLNDPKKAPVCAVLAGATVHYAD
jgi:6-phosphogluconolactonase